MKKQGRYILFHLLLSLRGFVKVICKFFIFMFVVGGFVLSVQGEWKLGLILIILGIMNYLLMIYYDKLLFKIKPDDMDLWLG